MATVELFGRVVELTVGRQGQIGRILRDMQIRYTVKMDDTSKPNTASIEVANMSRDTFAALQAPDAYVALRVGYDTDVPRTIFEGHPTAGGVRLDDAGVGNTVTIEAEDGGRQYRRAAVDESFGRDVGIRDVLDTVIRASGLAVGKIDPPDPDQVFAGGVYLQGPARDVLDRLARSQGARWFVRDGAVYFVGADADTGEEAVVFDASNLIGRPTSKNGTIEATTFTAPTLRPRKRFVVQSDGVSGVYVARSVTFEGDTGYSESSPFYTKVTGVPA